MTFLSETECCLKNVEGDLIYCIVKSNQNPKREFADYEWNDHYNPGIRLYLILETETLARLAFLLTFGIICTDKLCAI